MRTCLHFPLISLSFHSSFPFLLDDSPVLPKDQLLSGLAGLLDREQTMVKAGTYGLCLVFALSSCPYRPVFLQRTQK